MVELPRERGVCGGRLDGRPMFWPWARPSRKTGGDLIDQDTRCANSEGSRTSICSLPVAARSAFGSSLLDTKAWSGVPCALESRFGGSPANGRGDRDRARGTECGLLPSRRGASDPVDSSWEPELFAP